MTFDSNMQLVQQEAIPELYDITAGGYVWRYTSYQTDLTFLTNVYKATAIKRSGFTVEHRIGNASVSISLVLSDPIQKYIATTPLPSTRVAIYRAVASSLADYALLFEGAVKQVSVQNKIVTAECFQAGKVFARLPKIVYQSYCNWQVFDCDCGLDAAVWQVNAGVGSISGANVECAIAASYGDGYFTQGRMYYDGDFRFITNHVGAVLTLQIPFPTLPIGATVLLFPGCDGSPATCQTKFNNFLDHHLSMPYIPSHNPVIWGFK